MVYSGNNSLKIDDSMVEHCSKPLLVDDDKGLYYPIWEETHEGGYHPKIIHFWLGFSMKSTIQLWGFLHLWKPQIVGHAIMYKMIVGYYPLVNVYTTKTMENHHAITGKTHCVYGHFQ